MTTWFVLASGPSLTPEDTERVRFEHERGRGTVIAVNSTAFTAPFADYCFAMDNKWLKLYRGKFSRYRWEVISTKKGCEAYGARYVGPLDGKNSGLRAISYAASQGADPIIVLGLDCKHVDGETHHFGDHPSELQNATNSKNWPAHARTLAKAIQGRRVVNCSPYSDAFENMTLETYLGY